VEPIDVIILAAGQGKRMRSATPKVLHRVGGRAMIDHVLRAVMTTTDDEAPVVVVGHGADAVRAALPPGARTVMQAEQLGTGHAVMTVMPIVHERAGHVLVTYGDLPLVRAETYRALVAAQAAACAGATLLSTVRDDPRGYGRVLRDAAGEFLRIVEEADCTPTERAVREINTGIACFAAAPLRAALRTLDRNNAQGEYYLTDVFARLRAAGHRVGILTVAEVDEVMGINSRGELARAESVLRARTLERLMGEGVTIVDPATTYIADGAQVGADTVIHPFSVIDEACVIGRRCAIGPGAHLIGSRVGDGVRVWWSVVEQSEMGDACIIGPFSHLRPGCRLGRGVEVGNYAEMKKAEVGDGTKVHHMSYLGDAMLGASVNIGAGTVTCNLRYGSREKHRTIIDDGAFIGSDTMLNAPVRIGAGAVTGAGSVVTKDVPAGKLAIGVPARVIRSLQAAGEEPKP